MGIKDANNMGAAMAGAAYDTINRHLLATGTSPTDYDVIYTGDLGQVGSDLMCELFRRDGTEISHKHKDCGLMLYDREKQDVRRRLRMRLQCLGTVRTYPAADSRGKAPQSAVCRYRCAYVNN